MGFWVAVKYGCHGKRQVAYRTSAEDQQQACNSNAAVHSNMGTPVVSEGAALHDIVTSALTAASPGSEVRLLAVGADPSSLAAAATPPAAIENERMLTSTRRRLLSLVLILPETAPVRVDGEAPPTGSVASPFESA